MKKMFTFVMLILAISVFANEFKLIDFRKLPADFHAERNSVEDMDMEYCTALKVELDIPTNLSLKQKVYKKENIEPGVYYFFVTHKEKQITFTAPNFVPLTVDVPKRGLKRGVVYYVKLESILDVTVTLNVMPKPDRIILNDKIITSTKFKTGAGKYRLQIEKKGYKNIDEQITISTQNAYLNYTLGKDTEVRIKEVIKKVEVPATSTPSEPTQFSLERFNVIYEIISCEMYEDQIVLEMNITNIGDDRNVKIIAWNRSFKSRIFDDNGNEFFPQKINFANKSNNGDIQINLVSDIPTKAGLIFKKINKKAVTISKFDLGIWMQESDQFRMTFRNIPITKK